jgi:hypothetical protein
MVASALTKCNNPPIDLHMSQSVRNLRKRNPAPPFGQPRPQAVMDKVGFTVDKIRAAGKVAGTLVTADELPYWLEKGVQFFYVHSDPFLRLGLIGIKKSLGR